MSLDNEATVDALDECRFVAVGVIAAQEVIAAGGTRDQLWAAVWIYSSAGADPAPLAPLLTNPDPSVRAMAAGAAVCWGDPRGFAVLSEALSDAGPLAGARPPVAIRRFAAYALGRCINQDGTPAPAQDSSEDPAVSTAWQAWLGENADTLEYDETATGWHLP